MTVHTLLAAAAAVAALVAAAPRNERRLSARELAAQLAVQPAHLAPGDDLVAIYDASDGGATALHAAAARHELAAYARALGANTTAALPDADGDDMDAILENTRVAPPARQRPSTLRPVAIPMPRTCDAAAVYGVGSGRVSCAAALSRCLTRTVTSRAGVCACYGEHARCFKGAGCAEQLPRSDVAYCRDGLLCDQRLCDGSGAGAMAAVGAVAVAAALLAPAVLAAGGG